MKRDGFAHLEEVVVVVRWWGGELRAATSETITKSGNMTGALPERSEQGVDAGTSVQGRAFRPRVLPVASGACGGL